MSVHGGIPKKCTSLQKWLQCKYSIFLREMVFMVCQGCLLPVQCSGVQKEGVWVM